MRTTKMQKKTKKKGLGGVLFEVGGGRGAGRIEVIVKMQGKKSEGEELARVDVNEIIYFLFIFILV